MADIISLPPSLTGTGRIPPGPLCPEAAHLRVWFLSLYRVLVQCGPTAAREVRELRDSWDSLMDLADCEWELADLAAAYLPEGYTLDCCGGFYGVFPVEEADGATVAPIASCGAVQAAPLDV